MPKEYSIDVGDGVYVGSSNGALNYDEIENSTDARFCGYNGIPVNSMLACSVEVLVAV